MHSAAICWSTPAVTSQKKSRVGEWAWTWRASCGGSGGLWEPDQVNTFRKSLFSISDATFSDVSSCPLTLSTNITFSFTVVLFHSWEESFWVILNLFEFTSAEIWSIEVNSRRTTPWMPNGLKNYDQIKEGKGTGHMAAHVVLKHAKQRNYCK